MFWLVQDRKHIKLVNSMSASAMFGCLYTVSSSEMWPNVERKLFFIISYADNRVVFLLLPNPVCNTLFSATGQAAKERNFHVLLLGEVNCVVFRRHDARCFFYRNEAGNTSLRALFLCTSRYRNGYAVFVQGG